MHNITPHFGTFIAVPMTSLPADEYPAFRAMLHTIATHIEGETGSRVFCAALGMDGSNFGSSTEAFAIADIIRNVNQFIMVWPKAVVSSAILEIGYAMALDKSITIFTRNRADLPFMLREADLVEDSNIAIYPYNNVNDITVFYNAQMAA